MREIKFRAWDKRDGVMKSPRHLQELICLDAIDPLVILDYVFMQFTGLKDKDDVEIYDGDILQHPDKTRFKVFWSKGDVGFKAHY